MSLSNPLRRAALAAALAAILAGGAIAAPTESMTDTTTLTVQTSAGQRETVDLPELAIGETRALSTHSGAAATVTRTESGLNALIAGESFDVPLPDTRAGDLPPFEHGVDGLWVEKDTTHSVDADGHDSERRVVVISRHGDTTGESATDIELLGEGEDPVVDAAPAKRLVMVKRVRKLPDEQAPE